MRDVDVDYENVGVLACFPRQEGSKEIEKGTIRGGRGRGKNVGAEKRSSETVGEEEAEMQVEG